MSRFESSLRRDAKGGYISFSNINISVSLPSTRPRTTQFFSVGSIWISLALPWIHVFKITSINNNIEEASC